MNLNLYTQTDWNAVLPLFIVAGTALVVLLADLLARKHASRHLAVGIGVAGLLVAGVLCARGYGQAYSAFGGGFVLGGFTVVFEEIIAIAAIFSLVLYSALGDEERTGSAVTLMLWSTSGAMLMAGAANLMTIFLGLELLSLALYCLCGFAKRTASRESALKYLILSSTASGFMLYGMALLFGASGSVALSALSSPSVTALPLFWLGGGLFLIGIAFKVSLVPFHAWVPDVFQGAPLPVTAFMSVVTKAGALAVFARFTYALPSDVAHRLLVPMWVVAAVSMIVGNAAMIVQSDIKRLLAYSGIAQMGYIVAALAGATPLGMRYAIYYLVVYMFMNLGAFAVVALCSTENEEAVQIPALHGLARRRPLLAAAMTFFLLALAGLPPTAGFLGKILILSTNVSAGYAWLAGALILGTAISLYAYLKIVRTMYDRDSAHDRPDIRANAPLAWVSLAICLVAVLVLTFYPLTPSNVLPLVR